MNRIALCCLVLLLSACDSPTEAPVEKAPVEEAPAAATLDALGSVLAAQPDEVKARYPYRHPHETIRFFGIQPGMTVVEGLPGRGWYTQLLLPYLGPDGHLIGANYSMEMYPHFSFATEEFLEEQSKWGENFPIGAQVWAGENGARISAFYFGSMPEELRGTADVVFFARVLHNLARFSSQGDFLAAALADAYAVLKPGGIFGVVQHHARDGMSDEFADGSHGYLKKAFVIAAAERAGFEFVAESDINANPADQPGADDIVWRLPPSLATSRDDPELRARYEAVGESNRMTLKFRKPH